MESIYVVTLTVDGVTYVLDPTIYNSPEKAEELAQDLFRAVSSPDPEILRFTKTHRLHVGGQAGVQAYAATAPNGTLMVNTKTTTSLHVDGHPTIN